MLLEEHLIEICIYTLQGLLFMAAIVFLAAIFSLVGGSRKKSLKRKS